MILVTVRHPKMALKGGVHWGGNVVLFCCHLAGWGDSSFYGDAVMEWNTPEFEEITLCCEINSYVSATL